jgi:hypothetical protein
MGVYLIVAFLALVTALGWQAWQRFVAPSDDYEEDEELGRVKLRHGDL